MNTLLKAVLGTKGMLPKDDRLGVYAAPTQDFHGLTLPPSVRYEDGVLLEAREFCSRALACDPLLIRLLWLPEHEINTPLGEQLLSTKASFLSRPAVAEAYGHALMDELTSIQQPQQPEDREDYALRILQLGGEALGLLRAANPVHPGTAIARDGDFVDDYLAHARKIGTDDVHFDRVRSYVLYLQGELHKDPERNRTPLPETPETAMVEGWLRYVRSRYFMTD